jgi:hypothetical protein
MLYWNEIIYDLAKILTRFCSICFYVYVTKLQMFYVWAFCHATDINTIVFTTAVASVDEDMLRSVWTELDYRIDICHVTKGSNIEH